MKRHRQRDNIKRTVGFRPSAWEWENEQELKMYLPLIVIFSEIICLMSTNSWKTHQRWFRTRSERMVRCRPLKMWMRASQEHDRHTHTKTLNKKNSMRSMQDIHQTTQAHKKPPALNSYPFIKFKFNFFSSSLVIISVVVALNSVYVFVLVKCNREKECKHCKSVKICLFLFRSQRKIRIEKIFVFVWQSLERQKMAGNIKSVCCKRRICQKRVRIVCVCVFFQRHAFYLFPNVMQRFVTESYQPVFFRLPLSRHESNIFLWHFPTDTRVCSPHLLTLSLSLALASLHGPDFFFQKSKKRCLIMDFYRWNDFFGDSKTSKLISEHWRVIR